MISRRRRARSLARSRSTAPTRRGLFRRAIHGWSGDPAIAEDYAYRALRLSPFDPHSFHSYLALGNVRVRDQRYDEAAAFFANAVQANPRFSTLYAAQAAALAMAGRIDEAKIVARRLLELEPTFRIGPMTAFLSAFARPEVVNGWSQGLAKSGVPE